MSLRLHPSRPAGPVYFLSDAHMGFGSPECEEIKEKRLLAFLGEVEEKAASLIILGDLFDFWFEYRHAIPVRGFEILVRLKRVVESGVPVHFLGGNHDWWAGGFLGRRMGIEVHEGAIQTECQGRRLYVAHGDGQAPGDLGYRVIRRIFRNRLAVYLYRLVHPDLGIPLATASSHASRKFTESTPVLGAVLWKSIAERRFREGWDAVVIGHFHKPVHARSAGRDFIINGDWMENWSYCVLEGGRFELRLWEGKVVEPITMT
jgi:UDP-2,3-diacylglucosamine hydrolase